MKDGVAECWSFAPRYCLHLSLEGLSLHTCTCSAPSQLHCCLQCMENPHQTRSWVMSERTIVSWRAVGRGNISWCRLFVDRQPAVSWNWSTATCIVALTATTMNFSLWKDGMVKVFALEAVFTFSTANFVACGICKVCFQGSTWLKWSSLPFVWYIHLHFAQLLNVLIP